MLKKLRLIAFAETYRFITIHSLEFKEIWQNNSSESTWMIYRKISEFWHREFLTTLDMQWKRFTKSYENRPCQNFIKTVLTEGIYCEFVVGKWWKNITTRFFEINKSHFSSLVFNQPRCHGNSNSTHLSQNARMQSSVIKLYSCRKWNYWKNGCTRRQLQISNDNSVRVILQLHYELEFCMRPKQHHLKEIASVEF